MNSSMTCIYRGASDIHHKMLAFGLPSLGWGQPGSRRARESDLRVIKIDGWEICEHIFVALEDIYIFPQGMIVTQGFENDGS